jgi:hypothetical protein
MLLSKCGLIHSNQLGLLKMGITPNHTYPSVLKIERVLQWLFEW